MDRFKQTLINIDSGDLTTSQKVQLFELLLQTIDINTIQGMPDSQGITYNGVKHSNRFKKIEVGVQTMGCVWG